MKYKIGDHVIFKWRYLSSDPYSIWVEKIDSFDRENKRAYVYFLYGHHSISEDITEKDIIGIGDNEKGTYKINGWTGKYTVDEDKLKALEPELQEEFTKVKGD